MPDPINPILMLLPLNGSLAGTDRDGAFTATGSGALRYAPAEGARINYAINGSAEDAATFATYWSGPAGTAITRVAVAAHGLFCGRIVCDGITTAYGGGNFYGDTNYFRPLAGRQMWCKFKWKGTGQLRYVLFANYTFDYVSSSSYFLVSADTLDPPLVPPTDWEEVVLGPITIFGDVTAPRLAFAQQSDMTGVDAFDIYVDEVMFTTEDPTGWDYFDGDDGGVWLDPITGQLGTAYASPSVSRAVAWVEESTTNLCLNPSFEVDLSFWGAGAVTISRDSSMAVYGSHCLKAERNVAVSYIYTSLASDLGTVSPGDVVTVSCWMNSNQPLSDICIGAIFIDSGYAFLANHSGPTFSLTPGEWVRVEFTAPAAPALTSAVVVVVNQLANGSIGETFYMDAVQIEKKAYATSYCDGSLGTGYSWSGAAHGSASTRAAASIVFPTSLADPVSGAMVLRHRSILERDQHIIMFGYWVDTPGMSMLLWKTNADGRMQYVWAKDSAQSGGAYPVTNLAAGNWQDIYVGWDGVSTYWKDNDVAITTVDRDAPSASWVGPNISIGGGYPGSALNGPVATYDRPLEDYELDILLAAIDAELDLWTLLRMPSGALSATIAVASTMIASVSAGPVLIAEAASG